MDKSKRGKAFINNNVQITDLENNAILLADTCYLFNEMNHSISYGNTLLSMPMNEDTLYLTADTLFSKNQRVIYLRPILGQTSKTLTWLDSAIL